jgi:hypothetical protein
MRLRRPQRAAGAIWAGWLLTTGGGILLIAAHRSGSDAAIYEFWFETIVGGTIFSTFGVLLASRRPENSIGWIFSAAGLFSAIQLLTGQYAVYALVARGGSLPGGPVAALISNSLQSSVVMAFLLLLLLFPTGRPPSPRWNWAGFMLLGGIALAIVGFALDPGPLESLPFAESPLGLESAGAIPEGIQVMGGVLAAGGGFGALLSLLVRYHRSRDEQRAQLKWFAYAAVLGMVAVLVVPEPWGATVWTLGPSGLPVAAGVAILKYRLYDIDRIISRTLVYAILSAFLGAVYLGAVVILQASLGRRLGASPPAVAGTTLGVAALFRPARRGIQAIIDRRFDRARYDAQRTVEAFGVRLRDEVSLERLARDLLDVVRGTMAPAHASLWLRDEGKIEASNNPVTIPERLTGTRGTR